MIVIYNFHTWISLPLLLFFFFPFSSWRLFELFKEEKEGRGKQTEVERRHYTIFESAKLWIERWWLGKQVNLVSQPFFPVWANVLYVHHQSHTVLSLTPSYFLVFCMACTTITTSVNAITVFGQNKRHRRYITDKVSYEVERVPCRSQKPW